MPVYQEGVGFRDAYPRDVAPATWQPQPYEGWRQSPNIEDRREEGPVRGYAGGLWAEAQKQLAQSHAATKKIFGIDSPASEPMPFGQLARRLPQDPMPVPPPRMSTWTRSPNIEDRRETPLTPLEEARLIMRQIDPDRPHAAAAQMPVPAITQLGVDAGMLDVHPGHESWLADRIGALPSTITAGR